MFGSSTQPGSLEQMEFKPADEAAINRAATGLTSGTQAFNQAAQQAAGAVNKDFSAFAPTLNKDFTSARFGDKLDAFSQNMMAAERQQMANRGNVARQQVNSRFAGSNPMLASILNAQGDAQRQLAGNDLNFKAGTAQVGRINQGQQLANQTLLAQAQQGANAQSLGNAAQGQALQYQQTGLGQLQNLLAALAGKGSLFAKARMTPIEEESTMKTMQESAAQNGNLFFPGTTTKAGK